VRADEFVVGMWNTGGRPTHQVLGRVVEDLRKTPVVLPDDYEERLTFSGGACGWKLGDDTHGLLSRAYDALYRSKAEGGDTVVHLD
jgi:PleD family two-component response regulator